MMLQLLDGLPPEKYEIFVASAPDGPLERAVQDRGWHYITIKYLVRPIHPQDFVAFIELYRMLVEYKIDILHTHSSKTGLLGRLAGRLAHVPLIIHTVHGYPFHPFQPFVVRRFYMMMEKIAARFCDKVVFMNKTELNMSIGTGLCKQSQAVFIPNGVNIPEESKVYNDKASVITVGSVGRFCKQKNSMMTIRAAIEACEKENRLRFIFVGDGELYESVYREVEKNHLQERILLPGWQSDSKKWLQEMDIFLLYSNWEGLSLAILEAMSIGLPILCSDIKGNNELVEDTNGILIPPNRQDILENILVSLPKNYERFAKWGAQSRKKCLEVFNMKQFIDGYEDLYD